MRRTIAVLAFLTAVTAAGCSSGTDDATFTGQRVAGPAATSTAVATTRPPAPKPSEAPTTRPKPVPTHTTRPAPKPTPTVKRTAQAPRRTTPPRPVPTHTTAPPSSGVVHPGAFCSPVGATGHTSAGTLMRCSVKAGQDRARWRKA